MMPSIFRSRFVVILAGVILVAGAGALLVFTLPWGGGSPAGGETPPQAPVKWMEARQFFVEEWTEMFGTTQPLADRAARVTAPIEGRVASVLLGAKGQLMVEGQPVKKGDIIVQLDANLAKANRDKVEASHGELKQLTKQAELAVKLARVDVTRLAELSRTTGSDNKSPLVSPVDIEKAGLALDDAQAKLQAAILRQTAATKELLALDEQLLLYTLTAPIDGRLGRLLVVPGQTLPSGTLVADVVNIDEQIDVLCFVPPRVAKRLELGQPARIGGVDDPQQADTANAEGKVAFIAEQAEADTGNFAVKIRFPNNEMKLRASIALRIRVKTNDGKACLTLPESALFEDEDPPTVIVVEDYKVVKTPEGKEIETGKTRKLQVKLGIRDRVLHLVEVISLSDKENQWKGTLEDAKFVIERGQGLRNGDLIRLQVEEE
jgi:RND family efflux transporter MFP subunit